jgi:hypothetical protein
LPENVNRQDYAQVFEIKATVYQRAPHAMLRAPRISVVTAKLFDDFSLGASHRNIPARKKLEQSIDRKAKPLSPGWRAGAFQLPTGPSNRYGGILKRGVCEHRRLEAVGSGWKVFLWAVRIAVGRVTAITISYWEIAFTARIATPSSLGVNEKFVEGLSLNCLNVGLQILSIAMSRLLGVGRKTARSQ